jgi:hypothetical protein
MTTVETPRISLRRRAVLAMAASAIGLARAARAQGYGELVDVTVVDRETGQPMRVWSHDGRLFVAGRPGARYGQRVTNNSHGRVLGVMSVDGVNVITGQTAAFGQSGYVFGPHETYDVTGWRKSDREVAAFTFAPLSRSYAARTGRPFDVGVIGLAAFRERVWAPLAVAAPPPPAPGIEELVVTGERRAPSAAPAAPPPATGRMAAQASRAAPSQEMPAAQPRSEKLGTGHGAREWSAVTTVAFERATRYPQLVRRIEYDSYENLAAAGVIPRAWRPSRPPRPFPGGGYVPDPPGGF